MNGTDLNTSTLPNATATLNATREVCGRVAGDGEVDEVPGGLVAMGTILVIVASFISCFGVNLQKWAHNVEAQLEPEQRKGMLRSWRWWLGIVCMVLGSLMDMAALPFVPMSRVAALGSSTIVANIIITPLFLKEKLTRHDYVGCAITVSGTALACYFGAGGEAEVTSTCLLRYFIEPLFIVYIIAVIVILLVLLYFIEGFRRMNIACKEAGIVGGEGQPQALETVWVHDNVARLKDVPRDRHFIFVTSLGPQFYPSVHAIFAGGCGAQSVMFAKAVLIFFGNAVAGEDTGMSVLFLFACIIPCAFCIWNQLRYLNEALRIYCDAIFVLPVYQAVWICGGVASGLVFYQEYRSLTGVSAALFSSGIVFALLGLAVLANRKSRAMETRYKLDGGAEDAPDAATAPAHAPHNTSTLGGVIAAVENIPTPLPVFINPVGHPLTADTLSDPTHSAATDRRPHSDRKNPLEHIMDGPGEDTTCSGSDAELSPRRLDVNITVNSDTSHAPPSRPTHTHTHTHTLSNGSSLQATPQSTVPDHHATPKRSPAVPIVPPPPPSNLRAGSSRSFNTSLQYSPVQGDSGGKADCGDAGSVSDAHSTMIPLSVVTKVSQNSPQTPDLDGGMGTGTATVLTPDATLEAIHFSLNESA